MFVDDTIGISNPFDSLLLLKDAHTADGQRNLLHIFPFFL